MELYSSIVAGQVSAFCNGRGCLGQTGCKKKSSSVQNHTRVVETPVN
jgi:hypothetical protein